MPRRERVYDAFDSSMPVANRTGLAGRDRELERLSEAVLLRRSHAIVFGPRGSGKTSLARIFGEVADNLHALVLYNLASGDAHFDDLFRPLLTELAGQLPAPVAAMAERVAAGPFNARALANLLVEAQPRQPVVLVLDEFDRVESQHTKAEVAALMKLLSDMRSNVRLLLVGIAGNVEDLLEGHPSLRRHLVPVPIGGIDIGSMQQLLEQLVARAGMTITAEAIELITSAAAGSPYHVRLFGLHAALSALAVGSAEITRPSVRAGLQEALMAWREVGGVLDPTVVEELSRRTRLGHATAAVCWMAITRLRVDRRELADSLAETFGDIGPEQARDMADRAIALLRDDLPIKTADGSQLVFSDTLKPQFLLQIYCGTIDVASSIKPTAPVNPLRAQLLTGEHAA